MPDKLLLHWVDQSFVVGDVGVALGARGVVKPTVAAGVVQGMDAVFQLLAQNVQRGLQQVGEHSAVRPAQPWGVTDGWDEAGSPVHGHAHPVPTQLFEHSLECGTKLVVLESVDPRVYPAVEDG